MTSPPLAEETEAGRRYRNFKTGEVAVSVTTALKSVAKPEVEGWKIGMAANHVNENWDEMADWHPAQRKLVMCAAHEEYTAERARIGTLVHECCEAFIKGTPMNIPKEASPYMRQFGKFVMDKRPVFTHSEVTVWSKVDNYAGTLDAIAEIDGETWLMDFKTSKGVYPEYGMQLAALKYADWIIHPDCTDELLPEIDRLGVLHLRPRGWKLIPIEHAGECFKAFKGALELHRWKDEVADHVLGEAA